MSLVPQFTIFLENKVGRLNELLMALQTAKIDCLAMMLIDAMDTISVRMVVNYNDQIREILHKKSFMHHENGVTVVQLEHSQDLKAITCALAQAEVNLYYLYAFTHQASGKPTFVLGTEDASLATETLVKSGLKVLQEKDLAR
jgi:hypothetical protein